MKHYIDVDFEDIRRGELKDPRWCPLALAAKRYFKRACLVGHYTLRIAGTTEVYFLDSNGRNFVNNYDTKGPNNSYPTTVCIFDREEFGNE